MKKIIKILFLLLAFLALVATLSNSFDPDFGWHLRFGQDVMQGNFEYLDSYTWAYFGQSWVNHSWGGSILIWILHSNLTYFGLVLFTSLAIFVSIIIILKTFYNKFDINFVIITAFTAISLDFIIKTRPAMISLVFFALVLYMIERANRNKAFYFLPLVIWIWSFIHGSWMLGFIIINIYLFGHIWHLILKKYQPKYALADTNWNFSLIKKIILIQIISAILILINPYSFEAWKEVLNYFSESYFKNYITEWLPSYAYPVFIAPLILWTVSLVFVIWGAIKKKMSWSQVLLFLAFFYAAMKHKRNNLYLVLISTPVILNILDLAVLEIKNNFKKKIYELYKKIILILLFIFAILGIIFYSTKIHFSDDIWHDKYILNRHAMPYEAVEFLKEEIGNKDVDIFNEFNWGCYLDWKIPNARGYLDCRAAATWYNEDHTKTSLENYQDIKFYTGGFDYINNSDVEYIILSKNYFGQSSPNLINKFLFTNKNLDNILQLKKPQLIKMLEKSNNWTKIYSDPQALIWNRSVVD
jgi:hypothetical protein